MRRFVSLVALSSILICVGCAAKPLPRPTEPLEPLDTAGMPEDVKTDMEHVDRACGSKEAGLVVDYQTGKEDQEKFKTILGSITGGVGTAGGLVGGIGAFAISDQDLKKLTAGTGFTTAGLGLAGTIVTAAVQPGKEKIEGAQAGLTTIEDSKKKARDLIAAKPASWTDAQKADWKKQVDTLSAACKP